MLIAGMATNRSRLIALPTSRQPGILDMLKFSVMPLATAPGRLCFIYHNSPYADFSCALG